MPAIPLRPVRPARPYVELRASTAFSFLRAATMPGDLAERAGELGYTALAVGDYGGLYGAVRTYDAARAAGVRPIVAGDLELEGLGEVRLLVESEAGYRNLCRLFTLAHRGRPKGEHLATLEQLCAHSNGLVALLGHCTDVTAAQTVAQALGRERSVIEVQRHFSRQQELRNIAMSDLAERLRLTVVATNDVRYAVAAERPLFDVITCIRNHLPLDDAGTLLTRNAERILHSPAEMAQRFSDWPAAIAATADLADRCAFTLESLPYTLPDYPVPNGGDLQSYLEHLTWEGARARYRERLDTDPRVRRQLEHELRVIGKLGLAGYFVIVWDLVRFCREQRILAQGRGSAANSAVCYALAITAVDPVAMGLLFERFLSEDRGDHPDIDIDLPSGDCREQVIQYVYRRYGERSTGMTAIFTSYRGRSAVREVGKVLGLAPDTLDRLANGEPRFGYREDDELPPAEVRIERAGEKVGHPRLPLLFQLCDQLVGLPRHLSQHPGGMIIAKGSLDEMVPLEPAAMPNRSTLQWDKRDVESMNLIKIDLLGLGMLAAVAECVDTLKEMGTPIDLARLPPDDGPTYAAARAADTIGVFQIESRAQQNTLPRLKPRVFYDLVVCVGLIRPGPIAGKMVNPYLLRRAGRQAVSYPHESLKPTLERTLGIPLFQEQLMKMAMTIGGLTGGEAQELRKVMSHAFTERRARERMAELEGRMRKSMEANGLGAEPIEQIVSGIRAFAEYGFPESHAASFALIVYSSLYLKVHHPAVFLMALLNNQPMGFYSAATLIKDAQRHGVSVRPPCVVRSEVKATVLGPKAVRLGLQSVTGLGDAWAKAIVEARGMRPYQSVGDVVVRAHLDRKRSEALAQAGGFAELGSTRRGALWDVHGALGAAALAPPAAASKSPLRELSPEGRTLADYAAMGLTVGPHVVSLLRESLTTAGVTTAADLMRVRHGTWVRTAGVVIVRQRPGTAKGMVFLTLEDETGLSNAVLDPDTFTDHRVAVLTSTLLQIDGPLQSIDGVVTVKARRVQTLRPPSDALPASRDFH